MFIISSFIALSVLAASHPTMTRFVGVSTRHQSHFFISAIFDFFRFSIDKSIETFVRALETNVLEKSACVAIVRDADRSTLIQRLQYSGPISRFVHLDISWHFRSNFTVSKLDLLRMLSWNVSRILRNTIWKMECKLGNVMEPIWFFEEVECRQSSIFSMQQFIESLMIDL